MVKSLSFLLVIVFFIQSQTHASAPVAVDCFSYQDRHLCVDDVVFKKPRLDPGTKGVVVTIRAILKFEDDYIRIVTDRETLTGDAAEVMPRLVKILESIPCTGPQGSEEEICRGDVGFIKKSKYGWAGYYNEVQSIHKAEGDHVVFKFSEPSFKYGLAKSAETCSLFSKSVESVDCMSSNGKEVCVGDVGLTRPYYSVYEVLAIERYQCGQILVNVRNIDRDADYWKFEDSNKFIQDFKKQEL